MAQKSWNLGRWSVPKVSLIPALLLTVLVGFIFSSLRNYGPESTVRQFHVSLKRVYDSQMNGEPINPKDWNEVRSVFQEEIGELRSLNPYARGLLLTVYSQFQQGSRYSISKMDRIPREVRVVVLYSNPSAMQMPIVWVVEKPEGAREWKISLSKTWAGMN
jgi:hypothetical protein